MAPSDSSVCVQGASKVIRATLAPGGVEGVFVPASWLHAVATEHRRATTTKLLRGRPMTV
jgi:hypothetical protein